MRRLQHLFAAACLAVCAQLSAAPLRIQLVSLNDFHGNLEPTPFRYRSPDGRDTQQLAGGIEQIGGALARWRQDDPDLAFVAAGDLIGASPSLSAMWADEPTIAAFDLLGLRLSSAGNHEFDQGGPELLRQQHGGCLGATRPDKTCQLDGTYPAPHFEWLAANVYLGDSQRTLLPPFRVLDIKGVKVAFIAAVTADTPNLVMPTSSRGLEFRDEAQSINAALPAARAAGATVFVAVLHRGGYVTEPMDPNACERPRGALFELLPRLDPAIRVVISGDSHFAYNCRIDGRLVTQAEKFGHALTRLWLDVDPATGQLLEARAENVPLTSQRFAPDPRLHAYMEQLRARSLARLAQPVATLALDRIAREPDRAGESPLGDLVADSMLAAMAGEGAQIALMNTGGIRESLTPKNGRQATLGDLLTVLPYANNLVTLDLYGVQLRAILEHQWQAKPDERRLLQVSRGLHLQWDPKRPLGQRLLPGSGLTLNGRPIEDRQRYRIVTNNFLADGGSEFSVFQEGANRVDSAMRDIDALVQHLRDMALAGQPIGLPGAPRIELIP